MRSCVPLSLLLPAAVLACSGPEPSPTESRPEFAATCTTPTVSANPKSVTQPAQSTRQATFTVSVTCSGANGTWELSATRTGAVSTIVTMSHGTVTLTVGQSATVTVTYTTGSPGTGTVVLAAFIDGSPIRKSSGTHIVTVTGSAQTGIPYGPSSLFTTTSGTETIGAESFTLTMDGITAPRIGARIDAARTKRLKLLTAMTGGPHSPQNPGRFLSEINGTLQFDMERWKDTMDTYNTPAIKDAVARAVADGIIIGNSVMDEPQVHGDGDGNTWGPEGTMTKARVDSMCAHVKNIFPTLPVGVAHDHSAFEYTKSYQVCEFIISPWSARDGDLFQYRDAGLELGSRDHHAVVFSMNILNGGVQDRDGTWDCSGTGGKGQYSPNCRMTAAQVRQAGQILGVAGCAMTMWRYDTDFMSNGANQQAFRDVAALLATKPSKACRRG